MMRTILFLLFLFAGQTTIAQEENILFSAVSLPLNISNEKGWEKVPPFELHQITFIFKKNFIDFHPDYLQTKPFGERIFLNGRVRKEDEKVFLTFAAEDSTQFSMNLQVYRYVVRDRKTQERIEGYALTGFVIFDGKRYDARYIARLQLRTVERVIESNGYVFCPPDLDLHNGNTSEPISGNAYGGTILYEKSGRSSDLKLNLSSQLRKFLWGKKK